MADATAVPPSPDQPQRRGPGRPAGSKSNPANPAKPPTSRTLALRNEGGINWDNETKELLKQQIIAGGNAPPVTDKELALAVYICNRTGLDPFARQIYFIKRKTGNDYKVTPQVSIDGFRLNAQRTGEFAGSDEYEYGPTNERGWPEWARCTVHRIVKGMRVPFTATARWKEYMPAPPNDAMWLKMPFNQIGKCAEALALRKGFPAELSGLYTDDEMAQADNQPLYEAQTVQPGRIAIDVPARANPEPAKQPVSAPPKAPVPPATPKAAPPAPAPQPSGVIVTKETQKAFVDALTAAAGRNDKATLMKALKDLTGKARSIELTEDDAKAFIDLFQNVGIEEVEGVWKLKSQPEGREPGEDAGV